MPMSSTVRVAFAELALAAWRWSTRQCRLRCLHQRSLAAPELLTAKTRLTIV